MLAVPQADGAPESEKLLTLADLFMERAQQLGDLPFAHFPEESVSYRTLLERSTRLARGLIAAGLQPAEHVAILMPNCLHFLVAHYAVQLAGGRSILLNARFKEHELRFAVGHSDARMLLTTDCINQHVDYVALLRSTFRELEPRTDGTEIAVAAAPLLRRVVLLGDTSWTRAYSESALGVLGRSVTDAQLAQSRSGIDSEATAVLIYTSGTTAAPKACRLSHASLQRSWRIYTRAVQLRSGEKVWDPMPFFHSGGIGLMTGIMASGATIVSTAHFDPDVIAGLIERYRIEHLYPGFHTLSLPVLRSRHYDRTRWSEFVKSMVNTGPLGTQRVIQGLLPERVPVINLFGMSESSGLVTLASPLAPEEIRLASSGRPEHGAEVRIVDPESLAAQPDGVAGEIQFRGAGTFQGYYKDEAATRATILPGGWVRSGDLGRMDDGWLYFMGRIKDMLKVGGENVAAAELESFLSGHPAVRFVQVIGRPDERLGEVPVAFVELNPGAAASAEDLIAFCQGRIAGYKVPRQVVFVTEWPTSSTKVQKFRLKELLPGVSPA